MLGVFVSDYSLTCDVLERLRPKSFGIVFVQNGVYHATIKPSPLLQIIWQRLMRPLHYHATIKPSPLLQKAEKLYALSEDLGVRGLTASQVDSRVKVVTYSELVDVIFNDFEKIAWL